MNSQNSLQIVQQMLTKFDSPDKWVKGVAARDEKGKQVGLNSTKGVAWCIMGAIHSCSKDFTLVREVYALLYEDLNNQHFTQGQTLTDWNDSHCRKFEEVVDLLKRVESKLQCNIRDST